MKKQINKIAILSLQAVVVALMIISAVAFFAPEIAEPVIAFLGLGGSGALLANVPVAGTPTFEQRKENAPTIIERDISKVVTEIKPDDYPLDTMLRSIREAEKASNVKVEYDTVKYRERLATVTVTFTASATPANNESIDLTVGATDVKIFGADDTIIVQTINGSDSKPLRLHVSSVNRSAGTIKVSALNGAGTQGLQVPTIASGTKLYRMGTAKDELASQTDIISQLPTQDFNFCQIHMAFLEQSHVDALINNYSGYNHSDKWMQEIYNFRSSLEATNLFGYRKEFIDPEDDKKKYHADGVVNRMTVTQDYDNTNAATPITIANVLDLLEKTFSSNAGSERRLLLAGRKVITNLQKIPVSREIGAMEVNVVHGVTVKTLESNFGLLDMKHSKMLDQMGWENRALVLDLAQIRKHDLESMNIANLKPDEAGLRRVKNSKRLLENSCITVRYPETHVIWKPGV